MNSRTTRGRRSRDRRRQEKNLARRRQLFKRMTWLSGFAVTLIAVVVGGVIYAGSRSPEEPELSPITGLQIGSKVGNHLPEFDFRLVDGRTINSAELASANKPVFYFFFATW